MQLILHSCPLNRTLLFVWLFTSSLVLLSQEKITVKATSINSPQGEYAPVYYNNGLVFSFVNSNVDVNKTHTGLYY